jgi:hypothetical protein
MQGPALEDGTNLESPVTGQLDRVFVVSLRHRAKEIQMVSKFPFALRAFLVVFPTLAPQFHTSVISLSP